jgi:peptide/nickel transport system ATP-binding protein
VTEPLLVVSNLTVTLGGSAVVNNVSLHVEAGEIMGLVGSSGSGKSMTALGIMQLLPQGARLGGEVSFKSGNLIGLPESRLCALRGRDIGMVFQEPMSALNPLMSIGAQVAETVSLHQGVSSRQALQVARETLDAVGLAGEQGALQRLPYELSGGQRQRVAIALAMALSPSLLIADEPTTALDVITQAQVLKLLKELAVTRKMGLILITHDLAVVSQLAARVVVMHQGEVVEQGPTAALLRSPQHAYTRALIDAATPLRKAAPAEAARGSPVLQVDAVVKEYPQKRRSLFGKPAALRAVDGVSLRVHAGETVGLVGESGSGKTSLLKIILALQPAERGRVAVLGQPFSAARGAAMRPLRRAVQAVFQDPYGSFDRRWTVEQLIAEPFYLMDVQPTQVQRRQQVADALEQVGLSAGDATRHPHEFSGGQRQRIAIARALITQPALIVFDEAVSALDVLVRRQILQLLAQLTQGSKLACLFVTHDLQVVRAIADRVYVMQRGRIVEEADTETLFSRPRNDYTRALIDATPRLIANP